MEKKIKSPYTAAMTGCGFMWEEMTHILPLLMSPDSEKLLKQEVIENNYIMLKTEHTRKRAIAEFVRRYNSVPHHFWVLSDIFKLFLQRYSIRSCQNRL